MADLDLLAAAVAAARAEAAWLRGDRDRTGAEARRGLARTSATTDPWGTGELARWLLLAGEQPPRVRAAAPYTLELVGDWRGAVAEWERLCCPYDAALAGLAGDVPALLAAARTFERLGARAAETVATARLRDLGVRTGLRGPRASAADPHGLTERQREILALVAEGLTDTQVAARLHLSAKTVNHHVSAALGKLCVHQPRRRGPQVGRTRLSTISE